MADKQTGTGARGKQNKPKGQGRSETGNHTKTSTDNRSGQVKDMNRSSGSNQGNNQRSGQQSQTQNTGSQKGIGMVGNTRPEESNSGNIGNRGNR